MLSLLSDAQGRCNIYRRRARFRWGLCRYAEGDNVLDSDARDPAMHFEGFCAPPRYRAVVICECLAKHLIPGQ